MPHRLPLLVATALLLLPTLSPAATYIVPSDEVLIRQADLIVRGRVLDVEAGRGEGGTIHTDVRVSVEKVLSGAADASIVTLRQPGGVLGEEMRVFPGIGTFRAGDRVLLMLEAPPARPVRLLHFALGKFAIGLTADGEPYAYRAELADSLAVGADRAPHSERLRSLTEFESYIESVVEQPADEAPPKPGYFRDGWSPAPRRSVDFELIDLDGGPTFARWQEFDADGTIVYHDDAAGASGCPGGCHTETGLGVEDWNSEPGSIIALSYGGTKSPVGACLQTGGDVLENEIGYDDPCSEITDLTGCAGTLALGGFAATCSSRSTACPEKGNDSFCRIVFGAVMVNNGVGSCLNPCDFRDMMAHEAGHSLGFGHSGISSALMGATLTSGRCGVLQPDDAAAAQCVYPATGPDPLTCSANGTPLTGEANLTVSFEGTASGGVAPLSYDWDFGDGTLSMVEDPVHTYTTAGPFTATLTVTDSSTDGIGGGETCQDTVGITVDPCVGRIVTSVVVKVKSPTKVKLKVIGEGFKKGDVVQVDNGSGFQDVTKTKRKSKTKLIGKLLDGDVEALFPEGSTIQVRVVKPNGCASAALPASR